jgi:hypothetical protein
VLVTTWQRRETNFRRKAISHAEIRRRTDVVGTFLDKASIAKFFGGITCRAKRPMSAAAAPPVA